MFVSEIFSAEGQQTNMLYVQARSDLKNPNNFNFSSFFGDFCLKVFGIE